MAEQIITPITTHQLTSLFKSAWHFLKHKKLIKNPLYLVIGGTNSGKTYLIKQSGLTFITPQPLATEPHDESLYDKRCNIWFTEEATFLDVPSSYFNNSEIFKLFLATLKPYLRYKRLAGVITTINTQRLANNNKTELQTLRRHYQTILDLLKQYLAGPIPLYFLFTCIDQIVGFAEFFADLDQEDRMQPWGIELNTSTLANLSQLCKSQFDQLVKRLHNRVIWRLQQERNLEKRALIQQFPLQIDVLKNNLAHFIYELADNIHGESFFPLQGIYFVSSIQQGDPTNLINSISSIQTFSLQAIQTNKFPLLLHTLKPKSYFIKKLLKETILETKINTTNKFYWQQKRLKHLWYWLAGCLIFISLLGLTYSTDKKSNAINRAKIALAEYHDLSQQLPPTINDIQQVLPALNHLQQATLTLEKANLPWLMLQGLHKESITALTKNTYQSALNIYFLPSLGKLLEQLLTTTEDARLLYGGLKIYLMLADPKHIHKTFIKEWLNRYWQESFSDNFVMQQQLALHLDRLLSQPIAPLTLDNNIVNRSRDNLNKIPASQLAYAILENKKYYYSDASALINNKNIKDIFAIFPSFDKKVSISELYHSINFSDIYFNQINQASTNAINGDWITGKKNNPNSNITDLIKDVQRLYLQNYTAQWKRFLNNLSIANWQDWQQADSSLKLLLGQHSPFIQLLTLVSNNTQLDKLLPNANHLSSSDIALIKGNLCNQFIEINTLLPTKTGNNSLAINNLIMNIEQLKEAIKKISTSDDSSKASFTLAKTRFNQTNNIDIISKTLATAKTMPTPLQNWLTQLADNSWHLVLKHTAIYLNKQWQNEILPTYSTSIDKHYPFFKDAAIEISLGNFIRFFAYDGLLDNYFKEYLAPFIDASKAKWQWRSLDGASLNLSNNLLEQIERANIIRNMFFDDKKQLQINFSLRQEELGPEIITFIFALNEQKFLDKRNYRIGHKFSWPSAVKNPSLSLSFINNKQEKNSNTLYGTWALFRLIDNAQLQITNNTKDFKLIFDFNGSAARYLLSSDKVINPFIPGIIDKFRCPAALNT